MLVGVFASISGRYRWALWSGWTLTVVGAGLLCLLKPDTPVRHWIPLNIPIGIGLGMLFPSMGLAIQAACAPLLNAQASAFYSFLRTFGQSVGIAVSGVIFQNVFRNGLLDIPELRDVAEAYSRDATIVVEIIKRMDSGPVREALIDAYANALRTIWYCMVGLAGAGVILSLMTKGYSLQQEHVTQQALIQGEKRGAAKPESEGGTSLKPTQAIRPSGEK